LKPEDAWYMTIGYNAYVAGLTHRLPERTLCRKRMILFAYEMQGNANMET